MTVKAPIRDLFPLLRPYFSTWLVDAATGAYLNTSVATSPTWQASADPTAARNLTTGDALAPGSMVSGTDGVLYVADSTGTPKAQASTGVAQTWTGLQTFGDGVTLLDGDVLTMGTGADATWTPDGTNVVLGGAGAVLAKDTNLLIVDPADTTKRARFDAGGIAAGATRVINLPDQSVGLSGVVYASTVASTAITGATEEETAFDTNYTLAANGLKAGSTVRVQGWGICTATTGAETHTIGVKIGTVTLLFKGAINPTNNDIFWFDVTATVRTVGASGTLVASGVIALGAPDAATPVVQTTNSATIDTTGTNVVACYIDRQAGATDSDSARLDQFIVTVTAPPAAA